MSKFTMGVDVGSTTSKAIILKDGKEIISQSVIAVGTGTSGPARAIKEVLEMAGFSSIDELDCAVATGYGRNSLEEVPLQMSELSCHAKGAYFLFPKVRTIIDIGGQDSKALSVGSNGILENFVMNDKCAAGTGRFLDVIAKVLEVSLSDLETLDEKSKEDVIISSTCTVFAESEVVSLIAQNKATDDIVHGLNKAVAVKTAALTRRVGGEEKYMMTGGVSKNKGLVKTLEEKLGTKLVISDKAQLCGALGAALFAADMADV